MPVTKETTSRRPRALHTSRSFSRFESPPLSPSKRNRASTVQEPTFIRESTYVSDLYPSPESELKSRGTDVFESREDDEISADMNVVDDAQDKMWEQFDELPIEIRSLTERFLESLSNRVHPAPLTVDRLSELFQEFYVRADAPISIHIATLASRLSRNTSMRVRKTSASDQQMLTASEIADKRKARRQLEVKRLALEEAVERAVCEKVYGTIWRHRSTDDEERDEKLRSRMAALSVIGIGLRELRVEGEGISGQDAATKEDEIRDYLDPARRSLTKMDDEKYPLGKLHHLTTAHKSIVETLSRFFPSTSSADEILPTFIYTLITSPPESRLNIISNLNFIQRFRNSSKIDGEAAWCLTNAEAAVSFLETVDLASLRASEPSECGSKPVPSRTEATSAVPPGGSSPPSMSSLASTSMSAISATSTDLSRGTTSPSLPSPASSVQMKTPTRPGQQRRVSSLLSSHTNRVESASDALLRNADQAFDSINAALDSSFNFLFGRLKEQQSNDHTGSPVVVPKTLEDARKLVSTPPPEEDDVGVSGTSTVIEEPLTEPPSKVESRMLELIGGRGATRERSVDSIRSAGSGKKVAFAESKDLPGDRPKLPSPSASSNPSTSLPAGNAAVESMRNLGNTLNPLNRLASMNKAWGFGRSTPPVSEPAERSKQAEPSTGDAPPSATPSAMKELSEEAARGMLIKLCKSGPPIRRFVELNDPKQLTIGDVEELLKDYQRLAGALAEVGLS